jgi:hypothetical protein
MVASWQKNETARRIHLSRAAGEKWTAPKGWVTDGASIPRAAWTVAGGPFEGKYRAASVIHDVGCDQRTETWQDVHEVFFLGMMASGVEPWRAKIMYAAVYHFGPRWPSVQFVPKVTPGDFKAVKHRILKGGDYPPGTIFEVEAIQESSALQADIPAQIQDNVDLLVKLNPPLSHLSEVDFGLLEEKIKSNPEEWTLERIQNYRPKDIE